MRRLIGQKKSIIPSCDVSDKKVLEKIIKDTCHLDGIGGYKIGFELSLTYGLKSVVETIRQHTNLPIIYDHQKGGTDIPKLGRNFAKACKFSGVDSVILFPFGGAETEELWIKSCQEEGLGVIVGAHMTQDKFLNSEGGFICDDAPFRIFEIAIENSIRDFVLPGNKPELVQQYRTVIESSTRDIVLYAPGFISQGGKISECGKVAGENWHAIVGSAIYRANDIKAAARLMTSSLSALES